MQTRKHEAIQDRLSARSDTGMSSDLVYEGTFISTAHERKTYGITNVHFPD